MQDAGLGIKMSEKPRGMPGHCGRITPIWQSTRSCWRAPRALRIWDLRDKLHLARRPDRSDFIEFQPYPSYQPPINSVFSVGLKVSVDFGSTNQLPVQIKTWEVLEREATALSRLWKPTEEDWEQEVKNNGCCQRHYIIYYIYYALSPQIDR